MRVTISHTKKKEEVIKTVDRSFDDIFRGVENMPIQIVNEQKSWHGSTLSFSFTAKMGILSTPVRGTVEVTDKDVTVDADLGLLGKFLPAQKAQAAVESRVRGLLT